MKTTFIIISLLFFAAGGAAWFLCSMVFTEYSKYAVPIAAFFAAVGGGILILNAVIHPESIQVPEIKVVIPEINIHH